MQMNRDEAVVYVRRYAREHYGSLAKFAEAHGMVPSALSQELTKNQKPLRPHLLAAAGLSYVEYYVPTENQDD